MIYKLIIYRNDSLYREEELTQLKDTTYTYKWEKVESGSYSFEVVDENNITYAVTYNHTTPFAHTFDTYLDKDAKPKPITGFQSNIDILIKYNSRENTFSLVKTRFKRLIVDITDYGYEKINRLQITGTFNNWEIEEVPLKSAGENKYEIVLAVKEGNYEYKLIFDEKWVPEKDNLILIVGESGALFPKGELGTGKLSYDALDKNQTEKAIKHDFRKLNYLNKISENEVEFTIRTQLHDVERAYISVDLNEKDIYEKIYELERHSDFTHSFDYFKRSISFEEDVKEFSYVFILEDGNTKYYFDGKLSNKKGRKIKINFEKDKIEIFYIPNWAKEAIWYNIFPDRFYNHSYYNNPIFNEFGPENFEINKLHESNFEEMYKWNTEEETLGKFDTNRWTSDFSEKTDWEIKGESGKNTSLKYARMYGGDLQGIREKIPYMKELGINAVWLNPVFYSYQNHKYGTNDFRHISPDLGTIRTSGSRYNAEIDENNPYGDKSYVDILKKNAKDNSELKLLELKLTGENNGKNGYGETEDPSTWIWTESDLIMVDLIKELHRNGIRVIFDGVFNHSSNRHWSFNQVLMEGENSKYKNWYKFSDFSKHIKIEDGMSEEEAYKILNKNRENIKYSGWAGFDSLPEFNSYNLEFKNYIFNITKKWLLGPDAKVSKNWYEDDGIDGFRLDVPNCLENQDFWIEWREVVKSTKKDTYITAELWGNASYDINQGNKFDAVMNYEWLKTVIGYFINQGYEKNKSYKLKAGEFLNELREKRTWYPKQAIQASQNLNGSHDTDRLLSRIVNDRVGRDLEEGKQLEQGYNGIRPDLASNYHPNTTIDWRSSFIKPKDVLKLISVFQMTYVGAPMLFYGDEIGMWGATDPYCRKPMLWDEFTYDNEKNPSLTNENEVYSQEPDQDLLFWYKKVIKIRKENPVLVYGKFKELYWDDGRDIVAYVRSNPNSVIITVLNNSFNDYEDLEIVTDEPEERYIDLLTGKNIYSRKDGKIILSIRAKQGMILKKWKKSI